MDELHTWHIVPPQTKAELVTYVGFYYPVILTYTLMDECQTYNTGTKPDQD